MSLAGKTNVPGRVVQSVGCLTEEPEVPGSTHTFFEIDFEFFRPSTDLKFWLVGCFVFV